MTPKEPAVAIAYIFHLLRDGTLHKASPSALSPGRGANQATSER